jgi:hypothetical protein
MSRTGHYTLCAAKLVLSVIGALQQLSFGADSLDQFWVKRMSPDEVVDLIGALEGEVNNGGFHQYFYNSAGDNTAETIQARCEE